jgi:uncharacterized protein
MMPRVFMTIRSLLIRVSGAHLPAQYARIMSARMASPVRDIPARHRFEMELPGGTAFASYRRDGNVLAILHTEVPPQVEGRGHGSALVKGVFDIARAQGLKVVPRCPFVVDYARKHPEYADLLK